MLFFEKWDIFSREDLEMYEAMMQRLYLNECQKIVMRFEKYRSAALNALIKLKHNDLNSKVSEV